MSFIDNHGLCLYNTKTPTYLHPATGTYTSIDLSICFPTLLLDYDWKVHDDFYGSDHFPILLNNIGPDIDEPVSRWKLNKKNRKENPQKLTQLSSRSHPRHLVGKRTAQKDITIDTTSDSQVNSNFPNKWSPASLTFNNYFYLFLYLYIT